MDRETREQALRRHESMEFIGLRAQATVVGLLQLCTELVNAGVLKADAIGRIKGAIREDILVSRPRARATQGFQELLDARLDALFPDCGSPQRETPVGTSGDMQAALEARPEDL